MAQKNNLQFSIRDYTPADQQAVESLFRNGVLEHVYPAFFRAASHTDHVGVALSVCVAGYVLGGSSYCLGLVFGGAWTGLVYYCCRDIYEGYMLRRLSADMADIQASYLDNPDNGFWVAEADVKGQPRVVGMAAVVGRRAEEDGERFEDWNGGVMAEGGDFAQEDGGDGSFGEMSTAAVAFSSRRKTLGSQLTRRALDFCKERGLARLVLDVSSPQTAAVSMCQKLGFVQTTSHSNTHANRWLSKLARINVMRMEKLV
ncbi:LOW QUALITY PROTEIN: probable N-acetyltransferase camello [Embiotoca jacksoni]|uniref:LOW QUALITY PROTEIN: probable N-acetyltransferase camello n=1 Tax=Embiotoca jacksoni TaxID=100190 RepID=UPI0037049909